MTKARDLANASTALSAVSATELAFVDGVTSAIQTQIDAKAPSSTAVTLTGTQTLTNKTLTNPVIASVVNNTLIDAKGDIITATAADTPARLAVGANDTVLTAASGEATGLKWAAPAAGGMTLISTTTLSGTAPTISSIPQTYNSLFLVISNITANTGGFRFRCGLNGSTSLADYTGSNDATAINIADDYIRLSEDNTDQANGNNAWSLQIDNYTSTTRFKPFRFYGFYVNSSPTNRSISMAGAFRSNSAVSSIVFDYEGNTFTSGTVLLYGIK
jgi:hypothetical protein